MEMVKILSMVFFQEFPEYFYKNIFDDLKVSKG